MSLSQVPSLMDLGRIVDFLVCSAFYLLLVHSGDFQATYMWKQNQKCRLPFLLVDFLCLAEVFSFM